MLYALAPFIGWLVSGTIKFMINYLRYGKEARNKIGNGGFPSTHTTVMVTTVSLIGLHEGFATPIFGLGVAVTFIIIIDATGLRRAVGKHATAINLLVKEHATAEEKEILRESMGHTKWEILGGIILGALVGLLLYLMSPIVSELLSLGGD
ncbi:divergent PAP2 family protein [Brevibacillus laterosporus]|uniref:divergent PAP2 family protein n=1 Tax=Brevibacillus laterosporus TaxID=1465 RepID=UPI0026530957|nr:divergent PAP2 family protein [Brevibacillus laterosporus]MDN9010419.1 divergent PAP2 family protein [Brevibacillus laterosporus]MDO0941306.1 divergent PAP2 family protein [Brevibacillus laterosporus]